MGREGKGKEISPSVQPATCLKFHCARKSNVVCIFTRSTGAPSGHGSYEIWLWYTLMSDQVSFGCPYDLMSIVLPCRVGQTLTGLPVSASSVNALSSTRDGGDSAHATDGHRESLPPVRYDLHHNLAFNASRSGQIEKVSDASASGSREKELCN